MPKVPDYHETFTETVVFQGERYDVSGKYHWRANTVDLSRILIHDNLVDEKQDVTSIVLGQMKAHPAVDTLFRREVIKKVKPT
jgi:hypothetical protein